MCMMKDAKVAIGIGSDSDFPVIEGCISLLKRFEIEVEVLVCSAHRSPDKASMFAKSAEENGVDVIIAAAGKAAHLPGVLASYTTLPVIGVPVKSSTLDGLDSLLSIVEMPKGVPGGTMAINGGENAAIYAVQILSTAHHGLKRKLKEYKTELSDSVEEKNAHLQKTYRGLETHG